MRLVAHDIRFYSCLFLPINPVGMGPGGRIGMKKKYIVGLRAEEGSILEARLTRIACSTLPEGYSKWTLKMLADEVVAREVLDAISDRRLRRTLKKTNFYRTCANTG